MPKTSPWHSVKQNVYHDNTDCGTGNKVEREDARAGTGGKQPCKECTELNRREHYQTPTPNVTQ
ncbi:MAG TPA: hypothetical protein VHK27_06995 [Gammaproteobacteria bacterium]|nr:hypothetical protein [Gammaproteobacteria bacterium]